MPQLSCSRCDRVLTYSGDRPSFCAYCGQSLGPPEGRAGEASRSPTSSGAGRGDETTDFEPRAAGPRDSPDRVGDYRLLRQLGRGGMGTVYEAEDLRHGRRVAVKIIGPGHLNSESAAERFRLEGRLASSLSHPRCVFVLEADEDGDGRPYIVMELMSGVTLADLVEERGPLAIGDAVAKILDVVEGLAEAHRLGLIHRDVKPSNCFLEADGRVKIGDFGLSKSQVGPSSLTRTGSFLGTPLYASPEQIKVEPLDARTDVYSAAATLYFLLTGRAPFDRGDASATMARIVTDPAPSARLARPEVPIGLDRAIRKGLERDRDRRFRDLEEFRLALLPFRPDAIRPAHLGLRVGAYLFDDGVTTALLVALTAEMVQPGPAMAIDLGILWLYFSLCDGLWGGTPGKKLLRLQVAGMAGRERVGFLRAAIRAAIFLPLAELPLDAWLTAPHPGGWSKLTWTAACLGVEAVGMAIIAGPLLRRGGELRGLHDLACGTRVVGLPGDRRRRAGSSRRAIGRDRGSVTRPVGVMQAVGPYKVRGAVRWEPGRRVVSGEDSSLGREVWIVLRPKGDPEPDPARREVARATRPRWLDGGEQAEGRWDAYVAPAGCPLADLAGLEGLPWRDVRPILEDLADELAASAADGTTPPDLSVDQVWVQPDGRAILVDALGQARPDGLAPAETADAAALALIGKVAALGLEGGRRRPGALPGTIRAAIPLHASDLLGRIAPGRAPSLGLAGFRTALAGTGHLPVEVARGQRAAQVGVLAFLVAAGLGFDFYQAHSLLEGTSAVAPTSILSDPGNPVREAALTLALFPLAWAAWSVATRGGYSLRLAGLGLVGPSGRPASRWRCGWRCLLVWLPTTALLVGSVWAGAHHRGHRPWLAPTLEALAGCSLPALVALALAYPIRGPHDFLSGVRVVPR